MHRSVIFELEASVFHTLKVLQFLADRAAAFDRCIR